MDDDFGDGDIDSLALAIALQRAEIEDAEDREFDVLRSQLECIELAIQQEKDARMARSIAVANVADATAIEAVRCENEREFAAIEDDKDDEDLEIMQKQARPTTSDINTLSKLAGRYVSHETGRILLAQVGGGQEAWRHVEEVVDDPNSRKDCIICGEEKEFYDVVEAPCKDSYCQDCLQELFTKSFTDEGLFPPRCCRQPFVEEDIEIFLTREIRDAFKEKEVEFKTTNRTYCYFQTCSAFIAPDKYNTAKGYARCPKCPRLTCVECKKRHHGKNDCPLDEDAQALLALAEQQGWQRCARCDFLVEHNTGCYHMTCRCGHEFCYLCRATPWKSCGCVEWDEERLLERAEQVAEREGRDVQEIREVLQERHNCTHRVWHSCQGGDCDECGQNLPIWLYRCQQCRIEVCRSCRLNRMR